MCVKMLSKLISLHLHIQDFEMRILEKNVKIEKGKKGKKGKRRGKEKQMVLSLLCTPPWDECFTVVSFNPLIQQTLILSTPF